MTLTQVLLAEEWAALDEIMPTVQLSDGQILFHKGDRGDAFYIIESGEMRVFTLDEQGREIIINVLKAGEAFGEMALVDEQPRAASVSAIGPVTLRRLSRADFAAKILSSPGLAQEVIRLLSNRARDLTDYIERMGQWARLIAQGHYRRVMRAIEMSSNTTEGSLAAAAEAMRDMVEAIKKREDSLRQEVVKLRIQVDESGRQERVAEIVETEYFQSLAQRAQELRQASPRS